MAAGYRELTISGPASTKHRAMVRCWQGRPVHTRQPEFTAYRARGAKELVAQWGDEPQIKGPVIVDINCYFPKGSKTLKLGDVDNMAKCVLDTITHAALWKDDRQVWKLTVSKEETKEAQAFTRIALMYAPPKAKKAAKARKVKR